MTPSSVEYFELDDVDELDSSETFNHHRSVQLDSAIRKDPDFTLLGIYRSKVEPFTEYLVSDLILDGVPTRNTIGIKYQERIAIAVSETGNRPIDVLMLRRDFPILLHQNETPTGHPVSLCLYYDSPRAVARTWTAQKHLQRIKEWLELAAIEELHQADQPVERLFFETGFEMVLPWGWKPDEQIYCSQITQRADNRLTMSFSKANSNMEGVVAIKPFHFVGQPVVHGHILRHPTNLQELSSILAGLGFDLIKEIAQELKRRVGSGITQQGECLPAVILISFPVKRSENSRPESVSNFACMIPGGELQLGVKTGALFLHENTYYRSDGMLGEQQLDIDSIEVYPMDVLQENSAEDFAFQSGTDSYQGNVTLVGVGSLGSAILETLARSGWGNWTVIDNDHVKPHNLTRHILTSNDVGKSKVDAVYERIGRITKEALSLRPIHADVVQDFENSKVQDVIKESDLVIDCSTTLDYPRAVSMKKEAPRHISIFLAPNGDSSVFFAEDRERKTTLLELEAQYYRAIINSPWGKEHLRASGQLFESGGGCRDFSAVLSNSKIQIHSGILSDHIKSHLDHDKAQIQLWVQNPITKAVENIDVSVSRSQRMVLPGVTIIIDEGLLEKLRKLRAENLPNETGGILLGYHDFNIGIVVLVDALPAAQDSVSSPHEFERGVLGVKEAVLDVHERTAGVVGYIGEWHSHPDGFSVNASEKDISQLLYLGYGMLEDGLPAVSMIIGEEKFSAYMIDLNI